MALEEWQRLERAGRIKQLREESPFTQEALAERIGVKLRTYQKWEEGGGITWDHLEALADVHGKDVRWIHRGEEQETPDLMAELNSNNASELRAIREQLDRIEQALADLAAERAADVALRDEARAHPQETQQPTEAKPKTSRS